jgi:hypothetical protein
VRAAPALAGVPRPLALRVAPLERGPARRRQARRLLVRPAQGVLPRVRGQERRRERVARRLPAGLEPVRLVAPARSGHGCSWM